ncbi:hypothetical protein DPMN_141241 [Dreissena polymorpha]|uniref:Uncharacterized protein n=1 Tax=Dreissena polymorpha TaxID=45954 RepID=A0A9D4G9L5_DREPO|nr:hypothetical protein DPMN_141241 [Dreissena polymorpha]
MAPWRPCFSTDLNHLKFHDDPTINVASIVLTRQTFMTHNRKRQTIDKRVLTRKNFLPPGGHVFQPTGTIFKPIQDYIRTHLLTNVLTRKNAPPLGSHVFQANVTIFEVVQDFIETNLLTKFHDNKANVDSARRTTHDGLKAITKAHYVLR